MSRLLLLLRVVGIADFANFCAGKKEQAGRIFYRLAVYFSSLRPSGKQGQFTVYTVFDSCRAVEFNVWTLLLFLSHAGQCVKYACICSFARRIGNFYCKFGRTG